MLPEVVTLEALGGRRLRLAFDDGVQGAVVPDAGTIEWPNGADIDPVVLRTRVTGEPLPDWAIALDQGEC